MEAPQGARRVVSVAEAKTPRPRTLVCERCGGAFGCVLDGPCWCSGEAFKLPLPAAKPEAGGADCLCPSCLRAYAEELAEAGGAPKV